MKKLFGLLSVAVLIFWMGSCNKAADPQLLTDISSFETDWSGLLSDVSNLANAVKSETANFDAKIAESKAGTEALKGTAKTQADSLLNLFNDVKNRAGAIGSGADGILSKINEITGQFQSWKEKVTKLEIKTDAAKTDLANYKTQLEGLKGEAGNLKSSWDGAMSMVGTITSAIAALKTAPATPEKTATGKPATKPTTKPKTTTTTTTTPTSTTLTPKQVEEKMQNVRGNATKK
ncbi:MAG: hypothetical protein IPM47_02000 [Sphingobacteriales bacterium]|nr:MAG: hypothetical protein IPM47_02000 [Sphingobacteriales bacterium]